MDLNAAALLSIVRMNELHIIWLWYPWHPNQRDMGGYGQGGLETDVPLAIYAQSVYSLKKLNY